MSPMPTDHDGSESRGKPREAESEIPMTADARMNLNLADMHLELTPSSAPLAYLATPYTRYPRGIWHAFIDASTLAARLMAAGVRVYSPIAHTHPLAIFSGLDPLDLKLWLPFDEAMMTAAHVLIVGKLDGWDTSRGVAHEIKFFERHGKPIFDLDPVSLMMTRRRLNDDRT